MGKGIMQKADDMTCSIPWAVIQGMTKAELLTLIKLRCLIFTRRDLLIARAEAMRKRSNEMAEVAMEGCEANRGPENLQEYLKYSGQFDQAMALYDKANALWEEVK
jgi:hypothetical protein